MRFAPPRLLLFVSAVAAVMLAPRPADAFGPAGLFHPHVAYPTGSWPEAVAIGDVNGDGRNDVVLTTSYYFDPENDHRLHVFLQDAAGNLQPGGKYPLGNRPESVDIGDLNHDGRADVVVANFNSGTIGVLLQNSAGTLEAMVPYPTTNAYQVRVGDLDDDGRDDVAAIGWGTNSLHVFRQNAQGTLNAPTTHAVVHGGWDDLELGDVNGDGLTDIVVMSGQTFADNLGILLQQAGGGFGAAVYHDLGGNQLTSGVAVGDVNGDGRDDVVVSYGGNSPGAFIGVFLQTGAGTLAAPVSLPAYDIPEPVVIADVDDNGRADVLTLHGGWGAMGIYRQNASGGLDPEVLEPVPYASHYTPQGLAVGDVDGDGAPDAVIASYGSGLVLLRHRDRHALAVSMSDGPDPAAVGQPVTYTMTVSNTGWDALTGVTLTHTLPRRMTFVSSTPDSRTCTRVGRVITCRLGTLPAASTTTVTVLGRVLTQRRTERRYHSTVSVSAIEPEDPAGNAAAVSTLVVQPCTYPLLDGGFEGGTPNPRWTELSTNFGTPLCTLAQCGNGGGTAAPRSGAWWAWFGGIGATEAASLAQTVVLPAGSARLRFWLWNGASSGNGTDQLRVHVDGSPVFTAMEGEPAYAAGYVPVEVNLSPYADGAAHAIRFESATSGPEITSFSLDDVVLESSVIGPDPRRPLVCP